MSVNGSGSGIRGTTRVVGVFGYPVRHSASPAMHNAAFAHLGLDWVYVPFEVAPDSIDAAIAGIRALGIAGINVTVPLKELIPARMDALTDRARFLGSVNTIVPRPDGTLLGDSTDGPGFLAALAWDGVRLEPGAKAVVLGAGGSARAIIYALAVEAGAQVVIANRSPERAEAIVALLERTPARGRVSVTGLTEAAIGAALEGASLLVNTTSVGMHPYEEEMPPVPDAALSPGLYVADIIYNPRETRLLAQARARGCRTQNGIEMLVRQGALAFSHWTGVTDPPVEIMRAAVERAVGGA